MINLLRTGATTIIGRHPLSSNAAYVVECEADDRRVRAIYKPATGERPLWDFPDAVLGLREVAAFELAQALGLPLIPPTVWREDLPLGPGSMQQWIEDASIDDVAVVQERAGGWLHVLDAELTDGTAVQVVHRDLPELRQLALLDAVMNNADRKAGHLLRDNDGRLWAVDHGVTFHNEPKLRTVLWGFAAETIDTDLLTRLDERVAQLPAIARALRDVEVGALAKRIRELRERGTYPLPSTDWPAIPWPIF